MIVRFPPTVFCYFFLKKCLRFNTILASGIVFRSASRCLKESVSRLVSLPSIHWQNIRAVYSRPSNCLALYLHLVVQNHFRSHSTACHQENGGLQLSCRCNLTCSDRSDTDGPVDEVVRQTNRHTNKLILRWRPAWSLHIRRFCCISVVIVTLASLGDYSVDLKQRQ